MHMEVSSFLFGCGMILKQVLMCPGKGTTDAIFTVRQMQEKYGCVREQWWMLGKTGSV